MDEVTWVALTLSLTLLGGIYTWFAFRSRGFVAGLRGVGFTLIPVALLLTDTLEMVTKIGSAVGDWVGTSCSARPAGSGSSWPRCRWSASSWPASSPTAARAPGSPVRPGSGEKPARKELAKGKGTKKEPVLSDVDPEMAEIEALLRKRGIT